MILDFRADLNNLAGGFVAYNETGPRGLVATEDVELTRRMLEYIRSIESLTCIIYLPQSAARLTFTIIFL